MPFAIDLPAAARRHLQAAEILVESARGDVAGYLYGIAAECAVKAMMIEAGLRPSLDGSRRDDPFYEHFPALRTILRDTLQGRRGTPLIKYIRDDRFMNQWSTQMRYSHGKDVRKQWISNWAMQAREIVASIGT